MKPTQKDQWRIRRNYLYSFFKDFSFFSAVMVPFFTQWGGLTQLEIQLIQSWFSFWVFVLEIPTGAIADKIGRRYSIAAGSFIISLAVILYGSTHQFVYYLISEFIFALGYSLVSGADQALLYDTLKELGREKDSKSILGRADSYHLLGMLLAAPFGSLIASHFGINAPMLASSIPFFIASVVGWSIPEPQITSNNSLKPDYLTIVKRGFSTIRSNRVVRSLAIDSLLVSAAVYFLTWLNQPLQLKVGIPISYFGFMFAFLMGAEIVVSNNFSFFEKFLGQGSRYIKNTAAITAMSFFLVALIPNVVTVLIFLLLAGGLGYTRSTYIVSIANHHIKSSERSTVLSSISMLRRFAIICINPIVGAIADHSLYLALFLVGLLPIGTLLIKENID